MYLDVTGGGVGMISQALLANADALCAAAVPLMDLDETIMWVLSLIFLITTLYLPSKGLVTTKVGWIYCAVYVLVSFCFPGKGSLNDVLWTTILGLESMQRFL